MQLDIPTMRKSEVLIAISNKHEGYRILMLILVTSPNGYRANRRIKTLVTHLLHFSGADGTTVHECKQRRWSIANRFVHRGVFGIPIQMLVCGTGALSGFGAGEAVGREGPTTKWASVGIINTEGVSKLSYVIPDP
eukprot:1395390-Amorphochlora_amoeboformis.AAC.1